MPEIVQKTVQVCPTFKLTFLWKYNTQVNKLVGLLKILNIFVKR